MTLKAEIRMLKEMERMNKEIESIKTYLRKMIEFNLAQIKTTKPSTGERKVIERPIKKKEFLKWDEVKDEL